MTTCSIHGGSDAAHHALGVEDRATIFDPSRLVIDLVFVRGAAVRDPGVCPCADCDSLTDHLPVWVTINLVAAS